MPLVVMLQHMHLLTGSYYVASWLQVWRFMLRMVQCLDEMQTCVVAELAELASGSVLYGLDLLREVLLQDAVLKVEVYGQQCL